MRITSHPRLRQSGAKGRLRSSPIGMTVKVCATKCVRSIFQKNKIIRNQTIYTTVPNSDRLLQKKIYPSAHVRDPEVSPVYVATKLTHIFITVGKQTRYTQRQTNNNITPNNFHLFVCASSDPVLYALRRHVAEFVQRCKYTSQSWPHPNPIYNI